MMLIFHTSRSGYLSYAGESFPLFKTGLLFKIGQYLRLQGQLMWNKSDVKIGLKRLLCIFLGHPVLLRKNVFFLVHLIFFHHSIANNEIKTQNEPTSVKSSSVGPTDQLL